MRVLTLLSVFVFFAFTACNSVRVAERGMEGGASFGTSSKRSFGKNHVIPNATKGKNNHSDFNLIAYTDDLPTEKTKTANNEQQSWKQIPTEKPVEKTNLHTAQKTKNIKHHLRRSNTTLVKKSGKDNPDEGSLRWFVYLVLCFIIPPFAYFLIKRESDTLFWVCFICYLLAISFLGGFRYGILGLLSIVIALLALFQIDI